MFNDSLYLQSSWKPFTIRACIYKVPRPNCLLSTGLLKVSKYLFVAAICRIFDI